MIFSPLLIVATASLLSSSASASPTLFGRQQADAASEMITDPHAAPDVPSDHTTPIADGGNSWKEAFAKAQAVVEQMSASFVCFLLEPVWMTAEISLPLSSASHRREEQRHYRIRRTLRWCKYDHPLPPPDQH
jgi:hypothetical protein